MRRRIVCGLLPIAALGYCLALFSQTRDATLWVTLGDSDQIVEVDAYSFVELRRVKTDPKPHGLAASSDGSRIYVASDQTGNMQAIDARRGVVVEQIRLGSDPNQLVLTKDDKFAYVPLRGEDQVAVVQLEPLKLLKKIPSPKGPHDAYITEDGSRIYIGAQYGNAILVIDTSTQSLLHTIPTSDGVRPLELSRDGRSVYAALSNLLGFVVVDTVARKVTRRVELGTLPEGVPAPYLDTWTHSLQLSPDEKEMWVTDCINDLLRVVRLSDMKEIAQVRVGRFPHWFTLRPDGQVLFVSLWDSDAVAAVDVKTKKVLKNVLFQRGGGPKRILVTRKVTQTPFQLQEATIDSIHKAFAAHQLTCVQLTRLYLDRIEAYNLKGPALRAVITVNPEAMETAAALDRQYAANASGVGSLHCVPLVLKDNFNTADMPTTGGNISMKTSQPLKDAFTVAKLRDAGALIIGKTNLQEFARGGMSLSSLGGQVLNPYDLTRTPGGSSGGTGAAVAANLALAGTGSDTGQSIRSPASANSLVGVRPTRGLVSRAGVIPNSQTQDEVGPIARSVTDAALMLDVMAGYDPADPITAFGRGHAPATYTHLLRSDALKGVRLGVMTNLMGKEERHAEVNRIMNAVFETMQRQGATLVRFELPDYDALLPVIATDRLEARTVTERYFSTLPPNAPIKSMAALIAAKTSAVQSVLEAEYAVVDGMNSPEYKQRMLNRDKLRLAVANKMAELNVDAILYPHQKVLVVPIIADDQLERNGTLSNGTGFPAVTFPAGFSTPTATAPLGVPIGAELLGLDYSEDKLLAYAYAYERAVQIRRPPLSAPPLAREP